MGMVDVSNELIDNNEQFQAWQLISTAEHNFGDEVLTDESRSVTPQKDEKRLL